MALAAERADSTVNSVSRSSTRDAETVVEEFTVRDPDGALADVFALAAGTNRRIRQNLGWAFVYNAVAIPLAVAGIINPLLAALAMATSSLLVVANSTRSIGD